MFSLIQKTFISNNLIITLTDIKVYYIFLEYTLIIIFGKNKSTNYGNHRNIAKLK